MWDYYGEVLPGLDEREVMIEKLDVMKENSRLSKEIATLKKGAKVQVMEVTDNYKTWNQKKGYWLKIKTSDGKIGYVHETALSPEK